MSRTASPRLDVAERPRRGGQPRRSATSLIGGILLDIAAIGGVICIVLVILAFFFHITLIMFKTGSMSPGIPTGSLALVREIPAHDVAVGDIVTVDRAGKLPVTHRVTQIAAGSVHNTRNLTLKGDANLSEDPAPYEVATVRIVMASVPGLAYVVIWFSHPWVLGALTLGCSALVTWAFWPRSDRARTPRTARTPNQNPPASATRRSRRTRAGRMIVIAGIAGAALAGTGVPEPAVAAPYVEVVTGHAVVMTSIGDPTAMASLHPGSSVPWQVGITTRPGATPGLIDVSVVWTGSAELGLRVGVDVCTERWTADGCAGTMTRLREEASAPVDAVARPLLSMPSQEARWVRFEVRMPWDSPADGSASLTVTADGIGDSVSVSPEGIGALPDTGMQGDIAMWAAGIAVGAGLITAGIAAVLQRTMAEQRVCIERAAR